MCPERTLCMYSPCQKWPSDQERTHSTSAVGFGISFGLAILENPGIHHKIMGVARVHPWHWNYFLNHFIMNKSPLLVKISHIPVRTSRIRTRFACKERTSNKEQTLRGRFWFWLQFQNCPCWKPWDPPQDDWGSLRLLFALKLQLVHKKCVSSIEHPSHAKYGLIFVSPQWAKRVHQMRCCRWHLRTYVPPPQCSVRWKKNQFVYRDTRWKWN